MDTTVKALKKRIFAARGEIPADLVLRGGRIVNVFSGEIQEKDVAIYDGVIVGVGAHYHGKEEVDLSGKWIVPGLIDGHFHIESSMLVPCELAAALLIHGTTTLIADPHEIANVMGLEGIRLMLRESSALPFDFFFMAPSCVPATHLETAGATLTASDLSALKEESRVLGLAEMMNFPGVLMGDEEVLDKIVLFRDHIVDGHCPLLIGHGLQAYLTAGIRSDHEATDRQEGREKVESGMMLMIREGTSAKDLEELLPLINNKNSHRFCFVSDDLHAEDILQRGHLDFTVKKAIQLGLDPVTAIKLVTLNPATYFGLKDRGAIAPGYCADVAILDDLEIFRVTSVYKNGRIVADHSALGNFPIDESRDTPEDYKPLNIAPLSPESFRIHHSGPKARVIELVPGQLITHMSYEDVESKDGFVTPDVESDILKLSVVERHHASGHIGLALVRGFGLKRGAIASSVAHDSHNVIAVGASDDEIFGAVEEIRLMGGGLVVVCGDKTLAKTPLRLAGLMSREPLQTLVNQLQSVKKAASSMGCGLEEPFMTLSFLALPVIPELKLTDRGLVDVNRFEIVPLFL
ncbi:MAG: adenine deaminase [Desulfobacteraceae bacterium]|nr:MAG: adenine deaminase [Desulfobacteraceae bacterium]